MVTDMSEKKILPASCGLYFFNSGYVQSRCGAGGRYRLPQPCGAYNCGGVFFSLMILSQAMILING